MKNLSYLFSAFIFIASVNTCLAQVNSKNNIVVKETKANKSDPAVRARQFVDGLELSDTAKANRVATMIANHLTAVRDWHNNHAYTLVPDGLNPINGKVFSQLERQFIVDSTIPKSVHDDLITGLKKELNDEQIEKILDDYTIGKVAFTMNGYKSIVPNMTPAEEAFILTNLKTAREQAVDYKDMKEISIVFKIYKTRIEDYFNSNGRNWKVMYKTYVDKALAAKKAGGTDKKL